MIHKDKINYKKLKQGEVAIIYYNKDVKPVTSLKENPVYMINMLNIKDIPVNFKRIKKILSQSSNYTGEKSC